MLLARITKRCTFSTLGMLFAIFIGFAQSDHPIELLKLLNIERWREEAPSLHIGDTAFIKDMSPLPLKNTARELKKQLRVEGYLQMDPVHLDLPLKEMTDIIDRVAAQGLPLPFVYVFDEFWLVFRRLHEAFQGVLTDDYKRLPAFWAWKVDPAAEESGWFPHRDDYKDTLFPDGSPQKLSVWVPLTDATVLNGCMYVLPADRDPSYNNNDTDIWDDENYHWSEFIQDFRALPAAAESVLMWNMRVYHYGSRASKRAKIPRYSIGMELLHNEAEPHIAGRQVYDPLTIPDFEERIWLIAKQIYQFSVRGGIQDNMLEFSKALLNNTLRATTTMAQFVDGEL